LILRSLNLKERINHQYIWNVRKNPTDNIVIVHILVTNMERAAIVCIITGEWESYPPVISRIMRKELMTDPLNISLVCIKKITVRGCAVESVFNQELKNRKTKNQNLNKNKTRNSKPKTN
jgi:hypothetical protein